MAVLAAGAAALGLNAEFAAGSAALPVVERNRF